MSASMVHPAPRWRLLRLTIAWVLIAAAAPVGLLPGPGGIFLFAFGAAMLLRNSRWAKRRYVLVARRWPRLGAMLDRALRRPARERRGPVRPGTRIDSQGRLA